MASLLTQMVRGTESRSTLRDPDDRFYEALAGQLTVSGERVNEGSAFGLAAYYAAIRCISEDIAKLPLILYERLNPRGKRRATDHPLYRVLHNQPNPTQAAMPFWETLIQHALAWGNGYAEILKWDLGLASRPTAQLHLLDPTRVTVKRQADGTIYYEIRRQGSVEPARLPSERMFHLHGLGFDGVQGYSIARMARESLGFGLAAQTSGSAFFGNASRPGGILEHPAVFKGPEYDQFKKSWDEAYGGPSRSNKTAILTRGMTFHALTHANKDAQWIEARKFSVTEVARWFRIPPHKIEDLDNAHYNNIEHSAIEYVVDALLSWSTRIVQEIWLKLIPLEQQDRFFAEHLIAGLLRGDLASRYAAYAVARQWGWKSANDIRELENENPLSGDQGDMYLVPMNMVPADQVGVEAEPAALPAPEPEPDDDDEPEDVVDRMAEAHRFGLEEAYRRVLRVEADKLKRAVKRRNFATWCDVFYEEHLLNVRGALIPSVEAFCGAVWAALRQEPLPELTASAIGKHTAAMAERHVAESQRLIRQNGKGTWSDDRAAVVARAEMVELGLLMKRLCGVKTEIKG